PLSAHHPLRILPSFLLIRRSPPPTLLPYTTLFRSLLSIALHNLLDNAIGHGRAQGRVDVTVQAGPDGVAVVVDDDGPGMPAGQADRKSTRLNSSHVKTSYAVFCLKKKTRTAHGRTP